MSRGLFAAIALALAACGGDPPVGPNGKDVGGQCTATRDCNQGNICTTSSDFSGGYIGMCTRGGCVSDGGCPTGAACISIGGSQTICAVKCSTVQDCLGFGRGWTCKNEDGPPNQPQVLVCRLP